MKKAVILFTLVIALFQVSFAQSDLPLASWAVVENKQDFEKCTFIQSGKMIEPWGAVKNAEVNAERYKWLIKDHAELNLHYYCFNYEQAKKPDSKHEIVHAKKALSIDSFVHRRDYEANEIDGGATSFFSSKDFDTVHIYAISDSQIDTATLTSLNSALSELKDRKKSFYDKEGYSDWRSDTLEFFADHTDNDTHKMLKGPFDSGKSESKKEEEWGSLQKAGTQVVCYKNKGCAFYDLTNLTASDKYLYVLFAAGDGGGSKDDVMGLIKIPVSEIKSIGDHFTYYQYDPTSKPLYLDFAAGFLVVDSSKK